MTWHCPGTGFSELGPSQAQGCEASGSAGLTSPATPAPVRRQPGFLLPAVPWFPCEAEPLPLRNIPQEETLCVPMPPMPQAPPHSPARGRGCSSSSQKHQGDKAISLCSYAGQEPPEARGRGSWWSQGRSAGLGSGELAVREQDLYHDTRHCQWGWQANPSSPDLFPPAEHYLHPGRMSPAQCSPCTFHSQGEEGRNARDCQGHEGKGAGAGGCAGTQEIWVCFLSLAQTPLVAFGKSLGPRSTEINGREKPQYGPQHRGGHISVRVCAAPCTPSSARDCAVPSTRGPPSQSGPCSPRQHGPSLGC